MKKLFLIFLLCLLSTSSLHAKADIYVATGVLTAEPDTDADRDALQEDLIASNPEIYESQSFKSAYNTTSGFWDFIESASQLFDQNGWSIYWDSFITLTHNRLAQHYIDYYSGVSKNHDVDLSLQKEAYKASINAGNQVIVIAHSQGNFFTNEAYNSLNICEQKSFYMLGTANPANHVSGMDEGRGALATLDNDPITFVPSSMSANIINSERFSIAGLDMAHYKFHFFEYYRNQNSVSKYKIDTFPEYAIHHYNQNNSHTSSAIRGIIDIKLSWGNPSIHMNLQSDIGIKDISYSGCSPLEHYYVASEEDVSPGTYGVYVTNSGGIDDSYLPQSVNLNIHTPGAAMVFDFEITAVDMLNLGHVADIIITEDKKSEVVSNKTIGNVTVVKCYGDCKQPEYEIGTYQAYLYEIQSKLKQALLGPLSAADITLTKAENFLNNVAFYESSTSGGNSLLTSGIFYFTNEVLKSLESDTYYVMSVIGGDDIDADDDGKLDLIPTKNLGSIHAIVNADTITHKNFKVNVLAEIAFQLTQEMLIEDLDATVLQEKLDEIATRLLIEDVDGDEEINYKDLLAWVPIGDKEKLRKPYEKFYEPIVQKIYKNQAIYDDAYALAYEPFYRTQFFNVDEKAVSGKIVGKIELELSNEASYSLTQENDFFEILHDGTIIVKDGAILDHEINKSVVLHVQIVTKEGKSTTEKILISVNNIPEIAPTLRDIALTINTDLNIGAIIGNILQDSGDTPIIAMHTSPSSPFTVDLHGNIRVSSSLVEAFKNSNYFTLKTEATNSFGKSNVASLNISLTNIGFAVDLLDTNIAIDLYQELGTQVGTLQINYNKEAPIEQIELLGEYAFMFETDITGAIYLKENYQVGIPLSFVLSSRISNRYGVSDTKNVTIDFFSKEPYIFGLEANVDENSVGGTLVGSVPIITHGETLISSWKLSGNGSGKFTIDNDGTIRVAQGADLDYEVRFQYELNVQAFNSVGYSKQSSLKINVTCTQNPELDVNDTNDLKDPPTFFDTSLEIEEHPQANTLLGNLGFSTHDHCKISHFVWQEMHSFLDSHIRIDNQGQIYSTLDSSFDYEKRQHYNYNVYANTSCGESNTIELKIDLLDLDENGIVQLNSELTLSNAYISIQKIEANGAMSELFTDYVFSEIFNTHKFELEPDSFYMYEVLDGFFHKNNAFEDFQGKLRTIVKGSWMTEIERLRITPVSEAIVARLLEQKPILDPKTLEDDLQNLAKEYIHEDIDYNGEMNILDIIALDVFSTNSQYAIALDTSFHIRGDIIFPMNLGSLNIISINDGSLNTIELLGEGSEHFEINEHNELIMKSSIKEVCMCNYIFDILVTDMFEHKSIAKVSIIREPTLELLSSYETNTTIYKIASSKATETLYAAAGEEGVMVFTTHNQNLTPLTLYNAQTNNHIFASDSKIIAIATYLYGVQEILFALNQTTSTLEVIDITLPESPLYLSSLALRDFSNIEADLVISEDQKHLYVAGSFIEKINIEDLTKPLSVSALNLIEEMPWSLQFYIHEEKNGTLAVKTPNGVYMTYFVDPDEELFFIKKGDNNKVEYTNYFKYLEKGILAYTPVWNSIVALDLFRKDVFGNYKAINYSAWIDRFFRHLVDLTFSQDKAYLYVVDANGKIGLIGLMLEGLL